MKFKPLVSGALLLLASALVNPDSLCAQTVRLHGGVTLAKIISEQKAALEAQTGLKLEVVGNGSGRGLSDLTAGQADVALVAGSIKGVADAMNHEKAGSLDVAGLQGVPLPGVSLVFVINPAAGVKSLTAAQARDVLTGKSTNWKDVGGADLPIKVVMPFAGDGARVTVQDQILNGAEFVKDAIVRNSSKDIPPVIGQLPGSISFLSEKNAGGLTTVACDQPLQMPQFLVTKGEPAGDVKKIVDSLKASIK
jgi:phosphate transport system substrate-binding protein